MLHEVVIDFKFWKRLLEIDEQIAERVANKGCQHCGGRLHRGDYVRKPRGGAVALAAEGEARRISLCCDREGCRKRSLPPSVRFLGRKVYVGAAVVIACVIAGRAVTAGEGHRASGVTPRTTRRWSGWWQNEYAKSEHFTATRSRFMPPVEMSGMPETLWERFVKKTGTALAALRRLLGFLAPVTTQTVADGSRFVRVE